MKSVFVTSSDVDQTVILGQVVKGIRNPNKTVELNFRSLKSIENGNIYIRVNEFPDVCNLGTIDWSPMIKNPIKNYAFPNGLAKSYPGWVNSTSESNLLKSKCNLFKCHRECNQDKGCWGSGNKDCIQVGYSICYISIQRLR